VSTVWLVPVGNVPSQVLEWVESAATEWCPWPVRRLPGLEIPSSSYDARRRQYHSVEIMKAVARSAPGGAGRILGVTEVDVAIPTLTFVFGQAQVDGPVAVLSLARLRQEFYGLPADEVVLRERVVKEVLHELGHTFGLTHCGDSKCAMSLATHIGLVDSKEERYCARCGRQLVQRLVSENGEKP
jgi:archaemetzincin